MDLIRVLGYQCLGCPKYFFSRVPEKFPHSKDWTNDALKGQTKSAINIQ